MNTLLIGDMKRVDGFWEWLNAADEVFESIVNYIGR